MRRGISVGVAAAAAFVLFLIIRFPAQWASGALPRGVSCSALGGTLWSGTCAGLVVNGAAIGNVGWTFHPVRLLAGRLSVDLSLSQPPGAAARGRIERSITGTIRAENVHADLPFDRTLLGALPPGVRGTVQADLASLELRGKRIVTIRGQIDVRGLTDEKGAAMGDYRLSFPGGPGEEPVGRLSDLGGPLSVQGTVRLTREPGYVVDGLVAPRASATPDMLKQLSYLGTPDAEGRRTFSIAGTF
jgi:general secretion pathway protein N